MQKILFGGVFATHTEFDDNGQVVTRDEFHTRLYWELWASGAMMKLKGAKLHVLLTIVMHTDKNAECFPGIRRLEEMLPYNKNAINKAINELIELGFLERKQERSDNGTFDRNVYRIKYTSPPCHEKEDTEETFDNTELSPCPSFTDTVKGGHKEDLVVVDYINNNSNDELSTGVINQLSTTVFKVGLEDWQWQKLIDEAKRRNKDIVACMYNVHAHFQETKKVIGSLYGVIYFEVVDDAGWASNVRVDPYASQTEYRGDFQFYNWVNGE